MVRTITTALGILGVILIGGAKRSPVHPDVEHPQTPDERAWDMPKMELEPQLAEIFTVRRCKFISGMTCRIKYNGKAPLPSEVFFTEYDAEGKALGPRTRLIYPKLEKGETGVATFRLRSGHPARVVLAGSWNGPWRNPY